MLALLTSLWTGISSALFDAHRANLRSRSYSTAAFDPPTVASRVVPVVTRDGARLRVRSYGPDDAPAIVLVHGWTCALEYWNPQINAFAGAYRVIAYDQRGHGASEFGPSKLSMELLADDLADVLDATLATGQRAVLVGHSMGGMTLQAWAGRYPEQVVKQAHSVLLANTAAARLILETTVVPLFNRPSRLLKREVPLPFLLGRVGIGFPIVFPPIAPVKWLFARQIMSTAAEGDLLAFGMNIVRSCPALVRARFGLLAADMDLGESARNLVVPTSIVASAFDDVIPIAHSDRIAEMLCATGSLVRMAILPTGHLSSIEAHREFNAELTRLVEAAYPRPKGAVDQASTTGGQTATAPVPA
ncbi:alpha/beta fold hydrolase [Nocardia alba]|uniref:Pimeloyl-ACP methyl ester carboxylesterase n=1 Tax=Nocardia alba TaxID=225051 RepID=A0A4R1FML5_9NOCA|nr:alpha/beta hydrolase [Nocardia alba]TCJ94614.1 pimeloyl-ACP methyl ester carboxylesterase [Nocardia alba]